MKKTDDEQDFKISFGDIKSAYRIVYTTNITNQDQTKFDNTVILFGKDFLPKEAGVSAGMKGGVSLAKISTAYDPATQTITSEIKYNYMEKLLIGKQISTLGNQQYQM
ncbi:collagen binding domain-containing protein [Aneurinibacillus migulanus]|uniref:collagen binding domain-containing protein n=1 Tax=Aneurinibacillus migulanus TaxID=47500 RepID=UPI000A67747E|nr:collagen binding domain-containing protein [Aneurinibacillus migulanus]